MGAALNKIAFDLLRLVEEREAERAEALARGDADAAGEIARRDMQVEIVFEGDLSTLVEANFPLRLIVPELAGGHLTTEQMRALAERPEVLTIRAPAPLESLLDKSLPQIRVPEAQAHIFQVRGQTLPPREEGGGVTIGVIDSGIHARLETFRRNGGADTIIFRLWDQTFRFDSAGEPVSHDNPPRPLQNTPTDETGARATRARTPKGVGVHPDLDYGIDFTAQQINQTLHPLANLPVSLTEITGTDFSHGSAVAKIAVGHRDGLSNLAGIYNLTGIAPAATFIFVKRAREMGAQGLADAIQYIIAASRKENASQPIIINCSFGSYAEPRNGTGATAVLLDAAMADPSVAIVVGAGNERGSNGHAAFNLDRGTSYFLYVYVWQRQPKLQFFFSYSTPASLRWRMAKLGGSYDTGKAPLDQNDKTMIDPALKGHVFGYGRHIATSSISGDRHFNLQLTRDGGIEPGYWVIEIESEQSSAPTVFMHVWRSFPADDPAAVEFIPLDPMLAQLPPSFPPFTTRGPSSSLNMGVSNPSPQDASRPAVPLPDPSDPLRTYVRNPRPEEWIQCTITGTASAEKPIVVGAYNAETTPPQMTDFSGQGPDARILSTGLHKGDPKPDIAAPGELIDTILFQTGNPPLIRPMPGTSLAAPHVTGVLALMWAANPTSLSNIELKKRLLAAARKHPPTDPRFSAAGTWRAHNPNIQKELWGEGMLDALDAVKEALKP